MPEDAVVVPLHRIHLAPQQVANIRMGDVPQDAGDLWFLYCEGDTLYIHRSRTGHCVYATDLIALADGHYLVDSFRAHPHVGPQDPGERLELFHDLLGWLAGL